MEVGRVGRPHGLEGAFYVTRPVASLLLSGHTVTIAGTPREIGRRAGTDAKPFVSVTGCESREAAEALRGEPMLVDRAALPPLGELEFWPHELEGCEVVDGDRSLGFVKRMVALPSCEVLEVGDRQIPLVSDAIRAVDVKARRIEVDLAFLGDD